MFRRDWFKAIAAGVAALLGWQKASATVSLPPWVVVEVWANSVGRIVRYDTKRKALQTTGEFVRLLEVNGTGLQPGRLYQVQQLPNGVCLVMAERTPGDCVEASGMSGSGYAGGE